MTISNKVRALVRKRARFACEFCGIEESDAGGELTIDHYQPKIKGGDDNLDNLLYCCPRCNQYKLDYWPVDTSDLPLWNPRLDSASTHFIELEDGSLLPLTAVGGFTLNRLRLNRPQLVEHRLQKRQRIHDARLLIRRQETIRSLETLNRQYASLAEEQQRLLEELSDLMQLILGRRD